MARCHDNHLRRSTARNGETVTSGELEALFVNRSLLFGEAPALLCPPSFVLRPLSSVLRPLFSIATNPPQPLNASPPPPPCHLLPMTPPAPAATPAPAGVPPSPGR